MTDIHDDAAPEAPDKVVGGRLTTMAQRIESQGVGIKAPDPNGDVANDRWAPVRLVGLLAALIALGVWRPWILVMVVGVVFMIFMHELGHYVMAKRAGMKVTEFFIFFGPKIWSFRRGETEYGIKCIPAGAYVKIIGMTNLEEVDPADEARTYRQKTFWQRVGVAVAGSAMHFIMALVLIFVALAIVGQPGKTMNPNVQNEAWAIASVTPGSGAEAAGLKAGDKVLSIDGEKVEVFSDLRKVAGPHKGETVPVVFERNGTEQTTDLTLRPFYQWFVSRVPAGSPPEKAGLEVGDRIETINGEEVGTTRDLQKTLDSLEGKTVAVTGSRASGDDELGFKTDVEVRSLILRGNEVLLGVSEESGEPERASIGRALVQTPKDFASVVGLSMQGLGKFFTPGGVADFAGQVGNAQEDNKAANPTSTKTSATLGEGGPAVSENRLMSIFGLVRLGGDVGEVDPAALISLFALINIFIGIFNLVPLLPFDGGHVLIAVYERIQERRLKRRRYFTDVSRLLPLTYVVVAVMMLLFVSTIYLDIANPIRT